VLEAAPSVKISKNSEDFNNDRFELNSYRQQYKIIGLMIASTIIDINIA